MHETRLHFTRILRRTNHYISFYFISYNSTFTKYSAAESTNPQEANHDCIWRRRQWIFLAMQQNIYNVTEGERNSDKTVNFTKTLNRMVWGFAALRGRLHCFPNPFFGLMLHDSVMSHVVNGTTPRELFSNQLKRKFKRSDYFKDFA